jgi:signal transduction histidine kinase
MTINNDGITSLEVSKQIILFRIVQEAVQNAIKHANPSLINVNVERRDSLKVIIENNGEKLPLQIDGMGVRNMMNRAKVLGGKISWSTVNGLTRVELDLGNT